MKKYILAFFISLLLAVTAPFGFWLSGAQITFKLNDIRYFIDYLFLSGIAVFIIGMIIALAATSRWHYYRHLKSKFKGEVENDAGFEEKEKKRKVQKWIGAAIAFGGALAFAFSGYLAIQNSF